jgi:hypothetical protein
MGYAISHTRLSPLTWVKNPRAREVLSMTRGFSKVTGTARSTHTSGERGSWPLVLRQSLQFLVVHDLDELVVAARAQNAAAAEAIKRPA